MCTLTYLPHPGGFVMASSRDESRYRGGMGLPVQDTTLRACYPVDERSGGTWILTSADGYSLNLLNGGHRAHPPGGPYRHSRGLVPLLFAKAGGLRSFLEGFDPTGLEPFTLVVIGHQKPSVTDLVWTGGDLEQVERDPGLPRIWSSATLYDADTRRQREAWFHQAMDRTEGEMPEDRLMRFHQSGGEGLAAQDRTIRMARPGGLETVCLATVVHNEREWRLHMHDLVNGAQRTVRMIG
ncbi:MAG: hypothetical protein IPJ87_14360 [Flavobacteriales bacterium]|jgi:hypothetical protein|nr:hypothetical protein [Flavobacteriales bacterium]MBK7943033.1 hypothetical protein [Flavobacteriales bacterium]MBK8947465.1 hypothetical protein [Flavobacteriales bacterium]